MKEAVFSAVELIHSTDLDKWDEIIKLAKDDPDLPEIWRGANVGTRSRVSIGPRRERAMRAGRRPIKVTWPTITATGRQALGR
jgi:hypothetical protein